MMKLPPGVTLDEDDDTVSVSEWDGELDDSPLLDKIGNMMRKGKK